MNEVTVGRVGQLWRYPAKSMMGGQVDRASIIDIGLSGDRRWAVRDLERGGIRGAKKIGGLMQCTARYLDGESGAIEIILGSGETIRSGDPGTNDALSADLGHRVSLEPCADADDLEHFRRGAADTDDIEAELRSIFGREPDEPLPDLSQFPPEIIEFESPPGTYVDVHPIHLLTMSSLATLAERCPDSIADVRRFRPNIVIGEVESDADWPEQDWIGRSIQLGSVVLDIVGPCPRCVMVTRPVAGLDPDRRLLRSIVADAEQNLGVYATVRQTGTVAVGDSVTFGI